MQRGFPLPPAGFNHVSGRPISTSREPPQPQDWMSVQDIVRQLYVVQKLPLKNVRLILERDYNFRNASERMFKSRLKAWGYLKNAKKDDWGALAILHERRKKSGKRNTIFTVRGRERSVKDLHKYIRSLNMSEEEFLASIRDQDSEIPPYIRATTPDADIAVKDSPSGSSSEDYKTPPPNYTSELSWDEPSAARHLVKRQLVSAISGESSSHLSPSNLVGDLSLSATTGCSPFSTHTDSSPQSASTMARSIPCDQLQRDIEAIGYQITSPGSLPTRYGSEDIEAWMLVNAHTPQSSGSSSPDIEFLCSRCQQPSSLHFASLDTLAAPSRSPPRARSILNPVESSSPTTAASGTWQLPTSTRQHDRAWTWSALCFLACIALFRGDENASDHILANAASEFENMLRNEDPMLLTVAQVVAGILAMHNQGDIAVKIMSTISDVCERILPVDHPVRTLIELYTTVARLGGLGNSGITSDKIKAVYVRLLSNLSQWHPYSIAAKYSYGWILKMEGHNADSEEVLSDTYKISCTAFGPRHMQSIFALAGTAGAQYLQGKYEDALPNFETVIADATLVLGKSHPYTLEAKRRLALMIIKHEQDEEAEIIPNLYVEQLYWEVLAGRVKMLGRSHEYTQAMRNEYEELCKERGVWEDRERNVLVLFKESVPGTHQGRRSPSPTGSDAGSVDAALAY